METHCNISLKVIFFVASLDPSEVRVSYVYRTKVKGTCRYITMITEVNLNRFRQSFLFRIAMLMRSVAIVQFCKAKFVDEKIKNQNRWIDEVVNSVQIVRVYSNNCRLIKSIFLREKTH